MLKVDGNILNIEHRYAPLQSSSTASNTNATILSLQTELANCKNDNQQLSNSINVLKKQNQDLINSTKGMTMLTAKGVENIEKALESIKEKDLKIARMQDALTKKDSVMFEYIKVLKMKSEKK